MNAKQISLIDSAKIIREVLKRSFPNTKFSVRTKSYSGGCNVTVSYCDGPTREQVQKVVALFEECGFDGMQDLKTYNDPVIFNGERVEFNTGYVFVNRAYSKVVMQAAANLVTNKLDIPPVTAVDQEYSPGACIQEHVYVKGIVLKSADRTPVICKGDREQNVQTIVCDYLAAISFEATVGDFGPKAAEKVVA